MHFYNTDIGFISELSLGYVHLIDPQYNVEDEEDTMWYNLIFKNEKILY